MVSTCLVIELSDWLKCLVSFIVDLFEHHKARTISQSFVFAQFSLSDKVRCLICSDHPNRFNDKSLETIANCWPNLRRLSVGGPGITTTGLIHVGKASFDWSTPEGERHRSTKENYERQLC